MSSLLVADSIVKSFGPTRALDGASMSVGAVKEPGAAVILVTHEARVAAYSDREVTFA